MASRTLTVSLAADIDNLQKGLKKADTEIQTFGDKVGAFGKKAAKAFAVAGAAAGVYATKLLVDGVKAAIADEKANAKLATTLINVAGATQKTVDEVLAYSRATELATGVTEDELRPSLNRLAIATGNARKAMELQGLALDVAAGSGKSLDAVTQALAKAYEGNTASLGRLGIGISAAELKTMSFEEITKRLSETFAGQADVAANTFEMRIERLKLAFEDVRDSLAEKLLPLIERFITFLMEKGVPALNGFVAGLTGQDSVTAGITDASNGAFVFGERLKTAIGFVISIKDELLILGAIIAAVFVTNKIILFVAAIQTIVSAMVALRTAAAAAGIATAFATGGASVGTALAALAAAGAIYGLSQMAGDSAPSVPSVPNVPSGASAAQLASGAARAGTTVNNITVKAVDSEGAARAVAKVLNQSSARSIPALDGASIRRFQ
jgi:hypothetical protein